MGIYLGDRYGIRVEDALLGVIVLIGVYFFVKGFVEKSNFTARTLSILISVCGIGLGIFSVSLKDVKSNPIHFEHYIQGENYIIGQVISEVKKKKRNSTIIDVYQVDDLAANGKLLLYFGKVDSLIDYEVGDIIGIHARVQKLKTMPTPKRLIIRIS